MPRPKVDRVGCQVRLPRPLHEKLVEKAEQSGVSLNEAFIAAVARWLGMKAPPAGGPREVKPNFKQPARR